MADVKWIKITTDMFGNRKIKYLRTLKPDGDIYVLIWVMLLTIAGRCNENGMIFLTKNIPYTAKMLADELDLDECVVEKAMQEFERLEMVVKENGFYIILGWDDYQNTEGMERIREQNRTRQKNWYDRQRDIPNVRSNVRPNVSITQPNATEEDKDLEEELEKERDKEGTTRSKTDCQLIADLYNRLCPSFPFLRSMSEARRKAIRARLNQYTVDDFETMFKKAEASDFLKGDNNRNWSATFDWLINANNMAKVLDGNYDNKPIRPSGNKSQKAQELDDFYNMAAKWAQEGEQS